MDQVAEIRNKTDIVALIQSYIPLKKAGTNFKANCPFHGEKTPSFVISPERQIWHCFGCGKGGDAYAFLMEYEHMDFPEALRILANKAGIQLIQKGFDSGLSSKKENIYKLNSLALEFYHFLLTKHAVGKTALAYIENRGIKPQTIETYQLGFAPGSGVALSNYLIQKKKYNPDEVVEAGLAFKRGSRAVDFFRDRIIFPLFDHRNNVIGFSGRILTSATDISKYINTRETLVYHKGSVFFGLNSSKEIIKKEQKAIVMEGELDVISAFQEGITNTVAIKGTALTEDQVTLLARFAKTIVLCFDNDKAGIEAMKRSLPILEKKGITTTVLVLPEGSKDPDEAIKTNLIAFKKSAKKDMPVYDVLLTMALKNYDPKTADGKQHIGEELLPHIAQIGNEIIKEHYLRLVSKAIDTSYESLEREIDRLAKKELVEDTFVPPVIEQKSREVLLEEYLVALLVQYKNPAELLPAFIEFQKDYMWQTPSLEKITKRLFDYAVETGKYLVQEFIHTLPQELIPAYDKSFLFPLPQLTDDNYRKEVEKTAAELFMLGLRSQIKKLTNDMQKIEKDGTEKELEDLQNQLSILLTRLSQKKE